MNKNEIGFSIRRVIVGDQTITYTHRKKNVKNINLRINVDGSVNISSPHKTSLKYVDKFVERQAEFIFEALEKFQKISQKNEPAIHENHIIQRGKPLYLQGNPYKVNIIHSLKENIEIDNINHQFSIYRTYPQNCQETQKNVDKWIKNYGLTVFTDLCASYYPQLSKHQIPYPKIKTRKMKARWGSCNFSTKTITFADMLIHLPSECIEYVVVHELAHLVVPNHSKDFYRIVEDIMPDWKRRKQLMKDFGRTPSLE